jgi:CubicO group peptidase (beta-lactamase class C family)
LGITEWDWLSDAFGTTIGGQNLQMTPRSMAKLGLLYLHRGWWDGTQLVPADWVAQSLTPQGAAFYPPTDQNEIIEWYGYHWWLWKPDWFYGFRSFQAQGYAGQSVTVFPDLDLIIVTTANLNGVDPDTEGQQRGGIDQLIVNGIFLALTDVTLNQDIHIAR